MLKLLKNITESVELQKRFEEAKKENKEDLLEIVSNLSLVDAVNNYKAISELKEKAEYRTPEYDVYAQKKKELRKLIPSKWEDNVIIFDYPKLRLGNQKYVHEYDDTSDQSDWDHEDEFYDITEKIDSLIVLKTHNELYYQGSGSYHRIYELVFNDKPQEIFDKIVSLLKQQGQSDDGSPV